MKEKFIDVVFKKFQAYSFIIFLALVLGAFFALNQLNRGNNVDNSDTPPVNAPADPDNTGDDNDDDGDSDDDQGTVQLENETFLNPVGSETDPTVAVHFWSTDLSTEDQEAAVVQISDSTYTHTTGVVYSLEGESFNVQASLTGTVTRVSQDTFLGNFVEVEHVGGVKTVYTGLKTVNVVEGEKVDQGNTLGTAGTSGMYDDTGVYFQIVKGTIKYDPESYIDQPVSDLIG